MTIKEHHYDLTQHDETVSYRIRQLWLQTIWDKVVFNRDVNKLLVKQLIINQFIDYDYETL